MVDKKKRVRMRPKQEPALEPELRVDLAKPGSERTAQIVMGRGTISINGMEIGEVEDLNISVESLATTNSRSSREELLSSGMASAFARVAEAASSVALPDFGTVTGRTVGRRPEESQPNDNSTAIEQRISQYLQDHASHLNSLSLSADTTELYNPVGFTRHMVTGPSVVEISAYLEQPARATIPRIGLAVVAALMSSRQVASRVSRNIEETHPNPLLRRMQLIAMGSEAYLVLEVSDASDTAAHSVRVFDAEGNRVGAVASRVTNNNNSSLQWAVEALGRLLR